MQDIVHSAIVGEIDALIAEKGMTRSEFGAVALNDPSLIIDLENGRELRRSTERRVREAMDTIKKVGPAA